MEVTRSAGLERLSDAFVERVLRDNGFVRVKLTLPALDDPKQMEERIVWRKFSEVQEGTIII